MNAHTVGPWSVVDDDGIPVGIDGDNVRICRFPSWPVQREEMQANAHLIASAPELLLELEGITADYRKLFEAYQKATCETAFGWGLLPAELADKAIAKAKGEA